MEIMPLDEIQTMKLKKLFEFGQDQCNLLFYWHNCPCFCQKEKNNNNVDFVIVQKIIIFHVNFSFFNYADVSLFKRDTTFYIKRTFSKSLLTLLTHG